MAQSWMIYGANGYTGKLIAREAKARGMSPILAGRNREAIEALGNELSLSTRVFDCRQSGDIEPHLDGVDLVLHCAGPFWFTSEPMTRACLSTRTHYLDITGEIAVFERILNRSAIFREAGIVALPGVGFDVVPSDCLAAMLHRKLPSATTLALGLKVGGGPSPGTAKTALLGAQAGTFVRKGGKLVKLSQGARTRFIAFRSEPELAVAIPWGDVSTAFHSTGIPDIEVYLASKRSAVWAMRLLPRLSPLLRKPRIHQAVTGWISRRVQGPGPEQRRRHGAVLWGQVTDGNGKREQLRMETPDGYELTIDSALQSVERVLGGKVAPGAWTPSRAFGAEFALGLRGVRVS